MRDRLVQIRLRRERLVAKAAAQREVLAQDLETLAPAIRVVDRGLAGIVWLRAHPGVLLVAGGVMLVLRPRRTLRWSIRLFSLWQGYRRLTAGLGVPRARPAGPRTRSSA